MSKLKVGTILTEKTNGSQYEIMNVSSSSYDMRRLCDNVNVNIFHASVSPHFNITENKDISRPIPETFSDHVEQFMPNVDRKILYLITGLIEENGELLQLLRRNEYKGLRIDRDNLTEELGDILYFFTGIISHFGLTMEEIEKCNIKKLKARFPTGEYTTIDAVSKFDHE